MQNKYASTKTRESLFYLFKLGVDGGERGGFLILDKGPDFRPHADEHDAQEGNTARSDRWIAVRSMGGKWQYSRWLT